MNKSRMLGLSLGLAVVAASAAAADWPNWRGPGRDGTSDATGLVSSWSPAGQNLIWKAELTTRATPIVFDGRACVSGRVGDGLLRQELVACFDAGTGARLWERRFPVSNTTVPFTRVGWASPAGDPETGYVYAQNVDGQLIAFDRDGRTAWERRLGEEFGRASGFGGRTLIPLVDEDQLIVSVIGAGWGTSAAPRQRYMSLDKRTGAVRWVSTPSSGAFEDANNHSSPTVAQVGDRRLMIAGGADGWLYALDARTGEPAWRFQLSQRSINNPVLVKNGVVYAAHSEENIDTPGVMGRVVAIDASGSGDITQGGEIWRADALAVGFASPTLVDGRLYVLDNAAHLHALDAKTGAEQWSHGLGTIGRAATTFADGKLYVTEQTGHVWILKPGAERAEVLDQKTLTLPDGRFTEIWGSFAVAYGRLYFTAEDGLYCLGDPKAPFAPSASPAAAPNPAAPAGATPAVLRVVPAEVIGSTGEAVDFEAWAYDAQGRRIGKRDATWSLDGLAGAISAGGRLEAAGATTAGLVKASADGLTAQAQVRLFGPLPWTFDFADGRVPRHWIGAGRFKVAEFDGQARLHKAPVASGLTRSSVFIGPATMSGVTVEADLLATRQGRRMPDMGVSNQGYTLDLMGRQQKLQIRVWAAELDKSVDVAFPIEADVWYRARLRVDVDGDAGTIRGKVWKKGEPEPEAWSITLEDPIAVPVGAPGIYGDSPTDIYYDDITVKVNE